MAQPAHFEGPVSSLRAIWTTPPGKNVAPLMKHCALALQGELEGTSRFLDHYCRTMSYRFLCEATQTISDKTRAQNTWSILENYFDQSTRLTTKLTLPTFDRIWQEIGAWLEHIHGGNVFEDNYISYMRTRESFCHIELPKLNIMVFEEVLAVPELTQWIGNIFSSQPRHFDVPRGQHGKVFVVREHENYMIPPLTEAFQLYCFGEPRIPAYVWYMGSLAVSVQQWLRRQEVTPDESELEAFIGSVVSEHQIFVAFPFSPYSFENRGRIAQINVRNATEIFLANFMPLREFGVDRDFPADFEWKMFRLFTEAFLEKVKAGNKEILSEVRDVLADLGLGQFCHPTAQPDPTWVSEFDDFLLSQEDDNQSEYGDDVSEIDMDELPDVCFEPVGPELKIENYATAVTRGSDVAETNCPICIDILDVSQTQRDEVPVRVKCGHTFHYGCLSTLINGISHFSNLCPNCRHEICERRQRCLKSDDDLENVFNEVAEAVGAAHTAEAADTADASEASQTEGAEVNLQHNLQNDDGDVVMTDF